MRTIAHSENEHFTDSMRPEFKDYYQSKIKFLRSVIDEIIPTKMSSEVKGMALGNTYTGLSLNRLDQAMYQPMTSYIKARGKLFRPMLTHLCIEAFGENPAKFKSIIAISEIIHSCSLILDDIADASLLRRGERCAHLKYGIPRAANASSALTFYCFQLFRQELGGLSVSRKNMLYEMLIWEHYVTNLGSALDLGWAKDRRVDIPEPEFMQHVHFRSCSYTYRHASMLGAIVGGANSKELDLLFQYASYLGMAFQLIDDILNLKPLSIKWGKTIAEDITEGKRSLLVLHCLEKATPADRKTFLNILDGQVTDPERLKEALTILEKYGSFEYVYQKAIKYAQKAIDLIEKSNLPEKYIGLLSDFAWYVVERKI